ncbi:MAG: hypothetical protein ACTHOR_12820 [Devosia sp.]
MAERAGHRRLLFISNGHGEDSIAAAIIRRLPEGFEAEAFPTIGDGLAYRGVCEVVGPRAHLASQGWRNVKGSLLRDIADGGLLTILPALRFGREARQRYDRAIVVGDIVGVAGCFLLGVRDILYIDVYKTGYGRLYSAAERVLISRTARTTFCRSERLAAQLRAAGCDARCAGNVMMDCLPRGVYNANLRRHRYLAVTLLPGSRQFTTENFARQVEALSLVTPQKRPDLFLALADNLPLEVLAEAGGLTVRPPASAEPGDAGTLVGGGLTIHVARGATGNLIEAADFVLSQAGTATVQALGLGKPVVTFIDRRDRPSRIADENALFGEARVLVPADPERIAEAPEKLLDNSLERRRLGAIGRERIGGPGAMDAIIEAIVCGDAAGAPAR